MITASLSIHHIDRVDVGTLVREDAYAVRRLVIWHGGAGDCTEIVLFADGVDVPVADVPHVYPDFAGKGDAA